jgi:hypothetical protein
MPTPAAPRPALPLAAPLLVLLRTGRLVLRWWPPPPLRPTATTRQVRAHALADILDEAVQAQPAADRAVASCGEPGIVAASVIRDTAAQITVYHHLIMRLRALRLPSDLQPLGERASRLLAHHEWTLDQALRLACAPAHDSRVQQARRELNGLGAAADDLRAVRGQAREAADRSGGEAERPCGEGAVQ